MTTIFLDIGDEIYIFKSLTYNFTNKTFMIHTEKLETWKKATFFGLQNLQTFYSLKVSSKTLLQRRL